MAMKKNGKKAMSKPVPLGGVKKKAKAKQRPSVPAKNTGGAATKMQARKVGNANTPGFAYGRKTK